MIIAEALEFPGYLNIHTRIHANLSAFSLHVMYLGVVVGRQKYLLQFPTMWILLPPHLPIEEGNLPGFEAPL